MRPCEQTADLNNVLNLAVVMNLIMKYSLELTTSSMWIFTSQISNSYLVGWEKKKFTYMKAGYKF